MHQPGYLVILVIQINSTSILGNIHFLHQSASLLMFAVLFLTHFLLNQQAMNLSSHHRSTHFCKLWIYFQIECCTVLIADHNPLLHTHTHPTPNQHTHTNTHTRQCTPLCYSVLGRAMLDLVPHSTSRTVDQTPS
jgi:hypothetical protein